MPEYKVQRSNARKLVALNDRAVAQEVGKVVADGFHRQGLPQVGKVTGVAGNHTLCERERERGRRKGGKDGERGRERERERERKRKRKGRWREVNCYMKKLQLYISKEMKEVKLPVNSFMCYIRKSTDI